MDEPKEEVKGDLTPVEKKEEIKQEAKTEEVKEPISALDEAKAIMEETKKLLIAVTEERKRVEKANANMMIAGKGLAGETKKAEESPEDYAKRIMGGKI